MPGSSPLVQNAAQRAPKQRWAGLTEAFYDPIGSFNDGAFGGPIGGHSDHVHVSDTDPQGMLQAIALAEKLGLTVRENPYVDKVDPVHVEGSYHYRTFPGLYNGRSLGEAADVSGTPDLMAQYYRTVTGSAGSAPAAPYAFSPAAQGGSAPAVAPRSLASAAASPPRAAINPALLEQLVNVLLGRKA